MYLFNRTQPGGLLSPWCNIFNTTQNLMLFTAALSLIKGRCVSLCSRVIYTRLCLFAMIFTLNTNKRKSIFMTAKVE